MKTWNCPKRCHERSNFIIKTEDGHIYGKNRKYIRQIKTELTTPDKPIIVSDDDSNGSLDESENQGEDK